MTYKFPLERVLEMRLNAKEVAEREVERLNASLAQLKSLMQKMIQEYTSQRDEFNDKMKSGNYEGTISGFSSMFDRSLETKKKQLVSLLTTVKEVEADLDMANINLVQANRDAKSIENLKAKRKDEYDKRIETKERKQLDEMATMRHARTLREQKEV